MSDKIILHYPEGLNQSLDQTKKCTCGKLMVLYKTGRVSTTYPEKHSTQWKCFGCNTEETGPDLYTKTTQELNKERWERANRGV